MTHMLFGGAMARAGLNRRSTLATATLVISAEFPDCDVIWGAIGPVEGFTHHRGFTHTFLGAPLMAACVVGLMYAWHRIQRARGKNADLPAPRWGTLYWLALLGSLSHILLDFTNNYGVRPFMPFNDHWYAWDIVFIFEPVIFLALLLPWVMPWLGGLIGGEIGSRREGRPGRASAIVALAIVCLTWSVRDYEHRRTLGLLDSRIYAGGVPKKIGAFPSMINPFQWDGVVETQSAFTMSTIDAWRDEIEPGTEQTLHKPEESVLSLAAKHSRLGRAYLDWARFPYVEVNMNEPLGTGATVQMMDLRYRGFGNALGIWIELDGQGRVVSQRMGNREEGP